MSLLERKIYSPLEEGRYTTHLISYSEEKGKAEFLSLKFQDIYGRLITINLFENNLDMFLGNLKKVVCPSGICADVRTILDLAKQVDVVLELKIKEVDDLDTEDGKKVYRNWYVVTEPGEAKARPVVLDDSEALPFI